MDKDKLSEEVLCFISSCTGRFSIIECDQFDSLGGSDANTTLMVYFVRFCKQTWFVFNIYDDFYNVFCASKVKKGCWIRELDVKTFAGSGFPLGGFVQHTK